MKDHSEDNSRIGIPAVSGTAKTPTECIYEESDCFEDKSNY
jgi:hypothetical protein